MPQPTILNDEIDVVILCGGQGVRLSPLVSDRPKVLAPVAGRPFLDFLIDHLLSQGLKRMIFCVGYMADQVVDHVSKRKDFQAEFSSEDHPLGTGGALRNARHLIRTEHFLAMNGDTFFRIKIKEFYENHLNKKALASLAVARMADASDYGTIEIADDGRIINYREKVPERKEGLVSVGIYLLRKEIFDHMPEKEFFLLERELFPNILHRNCHGFLGEGEFIDIGVPERYEKVHQYLF